MLGSFGVSFLSKTVIVPIRQWPYITTEDWIVQGKPVILCSDFINFSFKHLALIYVNIIYKTLLIEFVLFQCCCWTQIKIIYRKMCSIKCQNYIQKENLRCCPWRPCFDCLLLYSLCVVLGTQIFIDWQMLLVSCTCYAYLNYFISMLGHYVSKPDLMKGLRKEKKCYKIKNKK